MSTWAWRCLYLLKREQSAERLHTLGGTVLTQTWGPQPQRTNHCPSFSCPVSSTRDKGVQNVSRSVTLATLLLCCFTLTLQRIECVTVKIVGMTVWGQKHRFYTSRGTDMSAVEVLCGRQIARQMTPASQSAALVVSKSVMNGGKFVRQLSNGRLLKVFASIQLYSLKNWTMYNSSSR